MKYAEVSVNSPVARRRTFSYAVPLGLSLQVGQAVWVPFGEKTLQGIVIELASVPAVEEPREIIDVIESEPLLSPQNITLASWLSNYYLAPLFDAVALMLPPGFERKAVTYIINVARDIENLSLTDEQKHLLRLLPAGDQIELTKLEKALGKKRVQSIISRLIRRGLLTRSYGTGPVRVKPKSELYISIRDNTLDTVKLPLKQASLLGFLRSQGHPVTWAEVRRQTGCSRAIANALISKGLVTLEEVVVKREPIAYENIKLSSPLPLTVHQQGALESIKAGIRHEGEKIAGPKVYLLHGVTGSGKTEVYLQALAEAVKLGKRGIVLVPEISLTPQTIERFASRFPRRVAVFHSRLSLGEQYDEWHRIRSGEYDVVIGSRSAVFTPQPDLGLIIIDEEYEWTYKQDASPHYHARDVALKLAEATGAVLVLGSATPDIETYYRMQSGDYRLLELPERVGSSGVALPPVEVVDMRDELKAGNRGMFSRSLAEAINEAVARREQVILFLNRRGGATFIQCRKCGFVLRCRRCDVPLTHHIAGDLLICHQCNYKTAVPQVCPRCSSRQLKFLGTGTQKVEQEVGYTFPRARVMRWDSDIISGKSSHDEILRRFRRGEADILVGTQMVAKGLDIPSVTLVGVISADTILNIPDFRAGERTYQLLSQVAGRAGRGAAGGRVIIQTFSPEHYAIQAAAHHDYASFYQQEIAYRRQFNNPPFSRLARLVYASTNDTACQREVTRMKALLTDEINAEGIAEISLIGPAPAYIHRQRGRYRWQLLIRGWNLSQLLTPVSFPTGWTADIDPISLVQ